MARTGSDGNQLNLRDVPTLRNVREPTNSEDSLTRTSALVFGHVHFHSHGIPRFRYSPGRYMCERGYSGIGPLVATSRRAVA